MMQLFHSGGGRDAAANKPVIPVYQPIVQGRGAPTTAQSFFKLAEKMLDQYRRVLLSPETISASNNNSTNNSKDDTLDRVTAYVMLNECSYTEQVEALKLLKGWFSKLITEELVEKILGDIYSSSSKVTATAALPAPRQTITRIATFLAAYSKLVAFAHICFLALETPQFLGKYLSSSTSSSDSNKRDFAGRRHHASSGSDASSFVSALLRDMLKQVAAERLKPFLLKHLPRVLQQIRIAHQRKIAQEEDHHHGSAAAAASAQQQQQSGEILDLLLNVSGGGEVGATSSASQQAQQQQPSDSSAESDLALLAYVVNFFRNIVSDSGDSSNNNSNATARRLHDEHVFRREFFDSYLAELRRQFSSIAQQLVTLQSSSADWVALVFSFLDSLISCERRVAAALFPRDRFGLQQECVRAARGAFVAVCAVPLVLDPRSGMSALLRRNALADAARLVGLVAAEADALPHLREAVQVSMRRHVAALFDGYEEAVEKLLQQNSRGTNNSSSSSSKPMTLAEIVHTVQHLRMGFVRDILSYILQWNRTIQMSPASYRMTLERLRKAVFRETLNGRALKGAPSSSAGGGSGNSSQAHIADVFAQYCDHLMRGDIKGDVLPREDVPDSSLHEGGGGGESGAATASSSSTATSLDSMVFVFELLSALLSFLRDKDVAIELHRVRTSRRLLERRANLDLECVLAHKLSRVVELSQTRKFEGMFGDVERWPDDIAQFRRYSEETSEQQQQQSQSSSSSAAAAEFVPSVMTSSKWPAFRSRHSLCFAAFPALSVPLQRFERFYRKQTQNARKLVWIVDVSTAAAQVAFPKGMREVAGSLTQMLVLMAVDAMAPQKQGGGVTLDGVIRFCCGKREEGATMDDLDAHTVSEIRSSLASLVLNPKFPVLRQSPDGGGSKPTLDTMRVEVNPDFSIRVRKFTVPRAAVGQQQQQQTSSSSSGGAVLSGTDDGSVPQAVLRQRAVVLDASIVRIMKSRQKLPLQELASLVTVMVERMFPVTFREIKKQVELLMERDFLKREEDEEESSGNNEHGAVFSYVA